MDKPAASRRINALTGGDPDEMFCHRVHVQQRLYGGFWLPLGITIDVVFYLLRRQRQHVRATYLLQRRETNEKTHQGATRTAQEETPPQQADTP